MEVKETLTLEFVFVIGDTVRVKLRADIPDSFMWARGRALKVIGYLAHGDKDGDDFFYTLTTNDDASLMIAYLREDVLEYLPKEIRRAPAQAA